MAETLRGVAHGGLERSCNPVRDRIELGTGAPGVERADISLAGPGFAPHRHDSYGLGITLTGVQEFRYRGVRRIALPSQLHVLHPDEMHDGAPATDAGLRYRIAYIEPALVRSALGGDELPFVADPVQPTSETTLPITSLLRDLHEPVSDLARAGVAAAVADVLQTLAGRPPDRGGPIDLNAVELARDHLAAHACAPTSAATLEQVTGSDRYTLARHFRRAFGTSPDRYRTLRRLALAKQAIERGEPIAQVAASIGFADQSHLTRQFKRTYGMTPARWAALAAPPSQHPGEARGRS